MVLKPQRKLWVPCKPGVIVPRRRPLPAVRPPIIPARRIIQPRTAVTLDQNGAKGFTGNTGGAVTSVTYSMTIGSGLSNSAAVFGLIVGAAGTTAPATVSSPAWNGVACTQLGTLSQNSNGGCDLFIFGILSPASGPHNFTATITNTGTITSEEVYAWGSSFSNVLQTSVATAFINYTTSNTNANSTSKAITTTNGNYTWGMGSYGTSGTSDGFTAPTAIWIDDVDDILGIFASAADAASVSSSTTYTLKNGGTAVDFLAFNMIDIVAAAAGTVVEEDNSRIPRRYWSGWTPNANLLRNTADIPAAAVVEEDNSRIPRTYLSSWTPNANLLKNTAQDISSNAVETNPHWRGVTYPSQWLPQASLKQNTADVPPPPQPETNTFFIPRSYPVQWAPLSLLRAVPNDFLPIQPETNTFFIPRTLPPQWLPQASLKQNTAQDTSSNSIETNPHWRGKTWPAQWAPLSLLRAAPNDFLPTQPETNTFFIPRTFPQQWALQASLMRGTAQDFSSIPPAVVAVYARYGAAHGIGMLSAIPGEVPS